MVRGEGVRRKKEMRMGEGGDDRNGPEGEGDEQMKDERCS